MSRWAALTISFLLACRRGEPPAPAVDASVAPLGAPGSGNAVATATPMAEGDARPAAPVTAGDATSDAPTTVPSVRRPGADDDAGGAAPSADEAASLPQTRDKPAATGAAFDARARALWDGITSDDPDRAMPFFFPLGAYQQVKAAANPGADWRIRLVSAYKRDIHALHKRLGEHAASAKLVRVEVPDERAKWVEPGEEYNKLGYYRVYGTRIVYDVDGRERTFEVSSLISWRGEWFVVHLTGFK